MEETERENKREEKRTEGTIGLGSCEGGGARSEVLLFPIFLYIIRLPLL